MDNNQLEQLVLQAKQGDQQALTQLYEQTKGYAYFVAKRYVKNDEDIKDILQDVYIAAFNGLDTLTDSSAFESWLYKIVAYKCLDFVKKKKVITIPEDISEDIPDDEELIPSSWLERSEKRRDILHIIDSLPDSQRIAIVLFYLEGLSVAEIAEQMELETGTVKNHLYRGRKAIKAAVLKEEKKGNKLYGVVAVPLLTQIMRMEAQAATMPPQLSGAILEHTLHGVQFGAGVASGSSTSLSENGQNSNGASSATVDTEQKPVASGDRSKKIKIGVGVLVIALIAGIALFSFNSRQPDAAPVMQPETPEVSQEEPQQQEEVEPEPEPEPDFEVTFANSQLESMLRSYLRKEEAPIMNSDLSEITDISILGGRKMILNGAEEYELIYETKDTRYDVGAVYFVMRQNVGVNGCQYIDGPTGETIELSYGEWDIWEDFSNLPNLQSLAVICCTIDNVQEISNLMEQSELKSIDLSGSVLPDVPFSHLTGLEKLNLSYTNIRDFSDISVLVNLVEFYAEGCDISDISFLSGLSQMEMLNLDNNRITDISALSNLTKIKDLAINTNQISDISPLANFTGLEIFDMGYNQIQDLTPLSNAHNLTFLEADFNQISDISMLSGAKGLEYISLGNNAGISDISALKDATKLTYLNVLNNNVSDISMVSSFKDLDTLNVGINPVSSLEPVRGLNQLTRLEFFDCSDINDLSPLEGMTSLTYLIAGATGISDLSPISGAVNMEYLYIYNTSVTDISVVANMPNLQMLSATSTNIADWSPAGHVNEILR